MAEMVDRVARALVTNFDEMSEKLKSDYRGDALRCISAMREPTEEMIKAGDQAQLALGMQEIESKDAYQAMIDAALKD